MLRLPTGRVIDPQQPLSEAGLDSLMAVELRDTIGRAVGRVLPATLLFDYPTLDALAHYLHREVVNLEPEPEAKPALIPDAVPAKHAADEPIAVIGIGCRFPGGATSPESFWKILRDGVDAVGEVPPERWDIDAYFDADPEAPGKTYSRWVLFSITWIASTPVSLVFLPAKLCTSILSIGY